MGPGQKSIDASDFPPEKTPYAMRDVAFLERQARAHAEAIGDYARELLAGPLPWSRMRHARALLGLVKKYGTERVEQTCALALAADMVCVVRLRRMLEQVAKPTEPVPPRAKVIPIARYLREPSQYALPLGNSGDNKGGHDK
jgi:hypothetical protein